MAGAPKASVRPAAAVASRVLRIIDSLPVGGAAAPPLVVMRPVFLTGRVEGLSKVRRRIMTAAAAVGRDENKHEDGYQIWRHRQVLHAPGQSGGLEIEL